MPADDLRTLPTPSPAGIDASCRVPLLTLFVCAVGWLICGSVFALIASLKFHSAGLLANSPWLTYGCVYPVSTNAMVYGFGLQSGLGVLLWLFCRLGRTKLALPGLAFIAALLWNFGVLVGSLGVLAGDGTGFEWLELPRYASPVLFCAYALIGVSGALTFHRRRARELYVSQWFLLAALFWFPWIYSTANLLLEFTPVRGVAQASVAWWYANNLNAIWFGCVGLAAIFYFLPKLAARPLHSRNFALITFWTLVVFGAWGGVPAGAPLPAWMPCLSTVCTVLTSVAIVAVTINCHQTLAGQYSKLAASPTLRFVSLGAAAWVLGSVVVAITSLPDVGAVTEFTWFVAAQARVVAYGFFAMTMFGAIYYLLPRLVQAEWPSPKLVGLHFWSAALGTILYVGPLAIGGVLEGRRMNDATVAFLDASKPALPFLRVSTLGDLLMALGHLLLLVNICWLLARWWRARWELALRSWTIKQAGVEEVAS